MGGGRIPQCLLCFYKKTHFFLHEHLEESLWARVSQRVTVMNSLTSAAVIWWNYFSVTFPLWHEVVSFLSLSRVIFLKTSVFSRWHCKWMRSCSETRGEISKVCHYRNKVQHYGFSFCSSIGNYSLWRNCPWSIRKF